MAVYDVAEGLRSAQSFYSRARYNPITSCFESSDPSGRRNSISRSGRITINLKRATISSQPSRHNGVVIPEIVYKRVLAAIQRFTLRRKTVFVAEMCKYWSLKREARRGASLLKRLQLALEGESARKYTRGQAERRLQFAVDLRKDLERVRMLIDDVKKREREKLRIAHLQKQFAETIYFPVVPTIEPILDKMENMDKEDLFLHLVAKEDAPDYYDIIKDPVSWTTMREKMQNRLYESVAEFEVPRSSGLH
jgi:NuA3 HAT complex component NTO1